MLRAALTSALHRPALQARHSKTAWFLRFPGATCPHAEHRCDVYAAGICSTRPEALCCKRAARSPQPLRLIARFEPALLSDAHTWPLDGSPRTAGHRPHIKGFDPDRIEAPRKVSGDLFDPVLAPVGLTRLQLRDRRFRSRAPIRATLGPGEPLLQHPQALGLTQGQSRRAQQFARRQRRRDRNTTVDAHHAPITRPRDRSGNVAERDMPAAGPTTGDSVGLDASWHRPRQPKPQPADLGHPHPTETAIQPHDAMRFHRNLPKPLVNIGLAPRRATMRAGKEVLHGLREIPQRLLLHRLTPGTKPRILGTDLGQLRRLVDIAGSFASRLPMPLLLHRQIPHIPRIPAVRQQHVLLIRSGQQPKPRHTRTLIITADTPGLVRQPDTAGRLPPRTEARNFQPKEVR